MTYRELFELMSDEFTEEQLDMDLSITIVPHDDDYYETINLLFATEDNDILDEGHPYFELTLSGDPLVH
jgi:hypothetical protein